MKGTMVNIRPEGMTLGRHVRIAGGGANGHGKLPDVVHLDLQFSDGTIEAVFMDASTVRRFEEVLRIVRDRWPQQFPKEAP